MKTFLFLFFFLVPLTTYGMRCFFTLRSGGKIRVPDWRYFAAVISSVMSMGVLAYVQGARFFRPYENVICKKDGVPVVLVHGLYHNPSAWRWISPELKKHGAGAVYVVSYNSMTRTFHEIALEIVQQAKALSEANGQPCVLIGHSLGGLLCRYAAAHPDLKDKVRGVLTLATPHQGSDMAMFAVGKLGRSLRPLSGNVPQLVNSTPLDENIYKCAFYTEHDNMVVPQFRMRLPQEVKEAEKWEEVNNSGLCHVSVLYRKCTITSLCSVFERVFVK